MGWFKTKQESNNSKENIPAINAATARVELEASADAQKEVIEKAKQASKELNDLLVENGFTIKIYLAAGGSPKRKT